MGQQNTRGYLIAVAIGGLTTMIAYELVMPLLAYLPIAFSLDDYSSSTVLAVRAVFASISLMLLAWYTGHELHRVIFKPNAWHFFAASSVWIIFEACRHVLPALNAGRLEYLPLQVALVLCVPLGYIITWALGPAKPRLGLPGRLFLAIAAKRERYSAEHIAFLRGGYVCTACHRRIGGVIDQPQIACVDIDGKVVPMLQARRKGVWFRCNQCQHQWLFRDAET